MGPFVLDTSMAMSWCFSSGSSISADAVLQSLRGSYAVVPSLWPFEIASALTVAERRQRIGRVEVDQFLDELQRLQIHIERRKSLWLWQSTLPLSRQYRLTAYDAAHLDLAKRESLPLATLDANLQQTASALQIPLLA